MTKEFRYQRAWAELAMPAFQELTAEMRKLVFTTEVAARELSQLPSLDMPWPSEGNLLQQMFNEEASLPLAKAAHAVWALGHWGPGDFLDLGDGPMLAFKKELRGFLDTAKALQHSGGYWKFANYADQILSERLKLERDRRNTRKTGLSFAVREGVLIACWDHSEGYQSTEFGWATEDVFQTAKAIDAPKLSYAAHSQNQLNAAYQAWDDYTEMLYERCAGDYDRWDPAPYMEERR